MDQEIRGRLAGSTLIAAALLEVVAMGHHPTVTTPDILEAVRQIARSSALAGVVHGVLMALMLIIVYGLSEFASRRGAMRPAIRAGIIAYLAGAFAMLGAAMVCFSYFFLPPVGHFTIADPQNWVALFTFLATAVIASHLSDRARKQAQEAKRRQQETERLYELSRVILLTGTAGHICFQVAQNLARIFECRSEVAALTFTHLQQRDGRWCIVDLVGKHGRVRTAPTPTWVKVAIDAWTSPAGVAEGHVFRSAKEGEVGVVEGARADALNKGDLVADLVQLPLGVFFVEKGKAGAGKRRVGENVF